MIIHVDMDAFYVSVEERESPALRGRPVVVAGDAEARGVVSAANYAAREYGVHSAMSTARALTLCRDLVVLPVRMSLYAEVSRRIRDIFDRYTPEVEPLSLDEAFLDTRGGEKLHGSAETVGREIKRAIRDELSLVASVGVAPNKFLAKLASDHDKPDGFTVVDVDSVRAFLDPMPVERLWGVGPATLARLRALCLHTVGDLRTFGAVSLRQHLGRHGEHLHRLSLGEDDRPVVSEREARSISHETTFASDISERGILESRLMELTESVGERLRAQSLLAKTVTVKLRTPEFKTSTVSRGLSGPTDSTERIWKTVRRILDERLRPGVFLRLVGVGVSGLEQPGSKQLDLFEHAELSRSHSIDSLADRIRSRFGRDAMRRGTSLGN